MFNVSLVHCLLFLLCAVTSLLVKCYTIHTYKCQVLSCCVSVLCGSCLTVMWWLSVTHAIHYITTLSSLSLLLYITHHSGCFTCYMYVHMHHANVCSVLHVLIVCLDHATHASSLRTRTVLVYHTYMYTHSIHCVSVVHHVQLFVRCYKTQNGSLVQGFCMNTVKPCYARRALFQ